MRAYARGRMRASAGIDRKAADPMVQVSRPDPANGRVVTDDEYEALAINYAADGIFGTPADTAVVYADSTGRQVKIRSAKMGAVRGQLWKSDPSTDEIVSGLPVNTSGNPRIDRLVLRYDRSTRQVRTQYLQGTPGASPSAPALTQSTSLTSGVYDFPLAKWNVANNYTTIAASDLTVEAWYPHSRGKILCTSTSRPFGVSLTAGMQIYETDTLRSYLWDATNSVWRANSGWELIQEILLGSDTAAMTFNNIPQYYVDLRLTFHGRTTEAVTFSDILMKFNNDGGSNYAQLGLTADQGGSSPGMSDPDTTTPPGAFHVAGSSFNTAVYGFGIAEILGYSNAARSNKIAMCETGIGDFGNVGHFRLRQVSWSNGGSSQTPVALTRVDLLGAASSNLRSGSVGRLYGMRL
jgi:hypothetical protein